MTQPVPHQEGMHVRGWRAAHWAACMPSPGAPLQSAPACPPTPAPWQPQLQESDSTPFPQNVTKFWTRCSCASASASPGAPPPAVPSGAHTSSLAGLARSTQREPAAKTRLSAMPSHHGPMMKPATRRYSSNALDTRIKQSGKTLDMQRTMDCFSLSLKQCRQVKRSSLKSDLHAPP